jgi:hypothetical protein
MTTKGHTIHAARATHAPLADLPAAERVAVDAVCLLLFGAVCWPAPEAVRTVWSARQCRTCARKDEGR